MNCLQSSPAFIRSELLLDFARDRFGNHSEKRRLSIEEGRGLTALAGGAVAGARAEAPADEALSKL